MKKIDKAVADSYFREKNIYMIVYLVIWFVVSFGVVLIAEPLSDIFIGGFPLHYYMGAQGAVIVFIVLLFVNAKVGDMIDKKYGIDEAANVKLSEGKSVDH